MRSTGPASSQHDAPAAKGAARREPLRSAARAAVPAAAVRMAPVRKDMAVRDVRSGRGDGGGSAGRCECARRDKCGRRCDGGAAPACAPACPAAARRGSIRNARGTCRPNTGCGRDFSRICSRTLQRHAAPVASARSCKRRRRTGAAHRPQLLLSLHHITHPHTPQPWESRRASSAPRP
jgi:hypothetical protein